MFKKISAVGVSCITALVLVLSAIASPASISAATLEEMANAAITCIISHEGSYDSVNPNDCGAVSIGKLQWHADRALYLMRDVCELCPSYAQSVLGSTLYNEIMSASTSWSYRTFSSTEASAAAVLLGSQYGVQAQDALASKDVQNYIITAQNKGITDPGALVLYADIYNFGCGIAARIAKRAASYAGSYAAVTLDNMYNAALDDAYGSNSAFVYRANMVYNAMLTYDWGEATVPAATTVTTAVTEPVIEFTEDGAGTYTVNATSLNMRSGPGTSYSIILSIPNEAQVTVTATGGNWAKVSYNGYEGYCSMDYLVAYVETSSVESTTTTETTTTAVETTAETTTETTTSVSEETTTESVATAATEETTTTTTTTTAITTETSAETVETTTEATEITTDTSETTDERNDVIVNSSYATIYGDVNCDGSVNVADAVLLHKYISGAVQLNIEQIANSDCSKDSVLSAKDVVVIMQHLVGHFTALPIV
ncbi:MAG: SH3 domain-containing protein [Ruminococcus sp.]|nr:SH3 domain-containing protein [Ruminococcus sp.]